MSREQAEKKNPALRHYGSIRVGPAGHNEQWYLATFGPGQYRSVHDTRCIIFDSLEFL